MVSKARVKQVYPELWYVPSVKSLRIFYPGKKVYEVLLSDGKKWHEGYIFNRDYVVKHPLIYEFIGEIK